MNTSVPGYTITFADDIELFGLDNTWIEDFVEAELSDYGPFWQDETPGRALSNLVERAQTDGAIFGDPRIRINVYTADGHARSWFIVAVESSAGKESAPAIFDDVSHRLDQELATTSERQQLTRILEKVVDLANRLVLRSQRACRQRQIGAPGDLRAALEVAIADECSTEQNTWARDWLLAVADILYAIGMDPPIDYDYQPMPTSSGRRFTVAQIASGEAEMDRETERLACAYVDGPISTEALLYALRVLGRFRLLLANAVAREEAAK